MPRKTLYSYAVIVIAIIFTCVSLNAKTDYAAGFQKSKIGIYENKGQISDQEGTARHEIKYMFYAPGFKIHFKKNSYSYEIFQFEDSVKVKSHRTDIKLIGANPAPEIISEGKSGTYFNYYNVPGTDGGILSVYTYQSITYKNIYPNIDLRFYVNFDEWDEFQSTGKGLIEYDFIINPGGDSDDIRMQIEGAETLFAEFNTLTIRNSLGTITEAIVKVFHKDDNKNKDYQLDNLNAYYRIKGNRVSFDVEEYDETRTLVIDPQLAWSTYFGGAARDVCKNVDIDPNIKDDYYVVGYTQSSSNIAIDPGAVHQVSYGGDTDAFLLRIDNTGAVTWCTYFGGPDTDFGNGVATDNDAFVIITGTTESTTGIAFPNGHSIPQANKNNGWDAFVAKFKNTGTLVWSTYFGGNQTDSGIEVDAGRNNAIVFVGATQSSDLVTQGNNIPQAGYGGSQDGYIAKLLDDGTLDWSTYYGGGSIDGATTVNIDDLGFVNVGGVTSSSNNIATSGAYQTSPAGSGAWDGFVARFNVNGTRLWGTYFGGPAGEYLHDIASDSDENIIIGGLTQSSSGIASGNVHSIVHGGNTDGFVAKFEDDGTFLRATYYGGNSIERIMGVAVDSDRNIIACGRTGSPNGISTTGAFQELFGGNLDGFLVIFDPNLKRKCGTYFGGTEEDLLEKVKIDGNNGQIAVGMTKGSASLANNSNHLNAPAGGDDGLITLFHGCIDANPCDYVVIDVQAISQTSTSCTWQVAIEVIDNLANLKDVVINTIGNPTVSTIAAPTGLTPSQISPQEVRWDSQSLLTSGTTYIGQIEIDPAGTIPQDLSVCLFDDLGNFVCCDTFHLQCPVSQPNPCDIPGCIVNQLTINTGYDEASSSALSQGDFDQRWHLISTPYGNMKHPAYVVDVLDPGWAPAPAGSQWISTDPWARMTTPAYAPGEYIFEYCFCVCNDGTDITLDMSVLCDEKCKVELDGQLLNLMYLPPPWTNPYAVNYATPLPLLAGQHCLRITVKKHNRLNVPVGLNVAGTITSTDDLLKHECCDDEALITGQKFEDINCDGVLDLTDQPIPMWNLNIPNSWLGVNLSTFTDESGRYSYTVPTPGTYQVCENQVTGWSLSSPSTLCQDVTINSTESVAEINFLNCRPVPCAHPDCITDIIELDTRFNPCTGANYSVGDFNPHWIVTESPQTTTSLPAYERQDPSNCPPDGWLSSPIHHLFPALFVGPSPDPYLFKRTFCVCEDDTPVEFNLTCCFRDQLEVLVDGDPSMPLTVPAPVPGQCCYNVGGTYVLSSGQHFLEFRVITNGGQIGLKVTGTIEDMNHNQNLIMDCCCDSTSIVFGRKFADDDCDGTLDMGDAPVSGWGITNTDATGTGSLTTTDQWGYYSFDGLAPGFHTVSENIPPGSAATQPPTGAYNINIPVTQPKQALQRDFLNCDGICDNIVDISFDPNCCKYTFELVNNVGSPVESIEYNFTSGGFMEQVFTSPCFYATPAPTGIYGTTNQVLTYNPTCSGNMIVEIEVDPQAVTGNICIDWTFVHENGTVCDETTCFQCQPSSTLCLDDMTYDVLDDPYLFLGFTRYTITNGMIPNDDICKIHIDYNPMPTGNIAGDLDINGTLIPTAQAMGMFNSNYTELDLTSNPVPPGGYVEFNLGIPYGSWSGNIGFSVEHCNGLICDYNSNTSLVHTGWTPVAPTTVTTTSISAVPQQIQNSLYAFTLKFKANQTNIGPYKWLSVYPVEADTSQDGLFAISGEVYRGTNNQRDMIGFSKALHGRNIAIFEFDQPLMLENDEISAGVNLVFRNNKDTTKEEIKIRWVLYDATGSAVASDTVGVSSKVVDVREFTTPESDDQFELLKGSPNPSSDEVNISYILGRDTDIMLKLFNSEGKELEMIESGFRQSGLHNVILNTERLPSGTYYINLSSRLRNRTLKIIVTH